MKWNTENSVGLLKRLCALLQRQVLQQLGHLALQSQLWQPVLLLQLTQSAIGLSLMSEYD